MAAEERFSGVGEGWTDPESEGIGVGDDAGFTTSSAAIGEGVEFDDCGAIPGEDGVEGAGDAVMGLLPESSACRKKAPP